MVFLPKEPVIRQNYLIYKGFDPECRDVGPVTKTVDWIEELGSLSDKLWFAAKTGLKVGLVYSVYDITHLTRITDRKLQIARAAYFTLPAIAIATGWMGGLEVCKKMLGRDKWQEASLLAGVVPAGIYAVWRRRTQAVPAGAFLFGLAGYLNQYVVDNDLAMFHSVFHYNPNEPNGPMDKRQTLFGMPYKPNLGSYTVLDEYKREPTWKKFTTPE